MDYIYCIHFEKSENAKRIININQVKVFWVRDEKGRPGAPSSYWKDKRKERERKTKSWICESFEHVGKCRSYRFDEDN